MLGAPDQVRAHVSRRRRRPWIPVVAGAVAALAVAAGVTAAVHRAPAAPSPLSAVTSALARTSAQSYTFSVRSIARTPKQELNSDLVSGAYDPSRHLGSERLVSQAGKQTRKAQSRFLGTYVYTSVYSAAGFGKLWDKSPLAAAEATPMPPGDLYSFASDQAVSPAELTPVLRSAGTAVHEAGAASGPGWTGTRYAFTASLSDGQQSVSGTVDVDRQGQVRRMTTTTQRRGKAGGKPFVTTGRDIGFGDFGAPVRVTTPPAGQVKYTSGMPYWGFYF
jgi:hypothetical protein